MTLLKLSSWIVCNEVHRIFLQNWRFGRGLLCYSVCKCMLVLRAVKYKLSMHFALACLHIQGSIAHIIHEELLVQQLV